MNVLSIIKIKTEWLAEGFYSVLAIDGVAINEWVARYADGLPVLNGSSIKDLVSSLCLPSQSDTQVVWQYLGLPENRPKTYVPLLTCPDHLDLTCNVMIVEQFSDETYVYWQRFGMLLGDIEKQDSELVSWFDTVPTLTFTKENFLQVFRQLNKETVKRIENKVKTAELPFPARPVQEEWEKDYYWL